MRHSRRYQKVKAKISSNKHYSLPESLDFLQNNNPEKLKNIKASFTLNLSRQKTATPLKGKIVLPYPVLQERKIAVIQENLPASIMNALQKNKQVELLTIQEIHQRIIK